MDKNCHWYVTFGIDGGGESFAVIDTEKPWFPIMRTQRILENKHHKTCIIRSWRLLDEAQVQEFKEATRGSGSNARK